MSFNFTIVYKSINWNFSNDEVIYNGMKYLHFFLSFWIITSREKYISFFCARVSYSTYYGNEIIKSILKTQNQAWNKVSSFNIVAFIEGGNRTGSVLKAGFHFGLDCGLWAICPVSMKTTYQLENQAPGRKSPRALYHLKEYPNYLCNQIHTFYYAYWGMTTSLLITVHC